MFLTRLGADRIMFGSDAPENIPVELVKYRSLGLREENLSACLGGTAVRLYRLEEGDNPPGGLAPTFLKS